MTKPVEFAEKLLHFINSSPSEFHVVKNVQDHLAQANFEYLDPADEWNLKSGGRYVTTTNGSAFIAFIVGTGDLAKEGFRIVEAHTDSPTIKIKPNPEMVAGNHYMRLNAEVYGSPIFNTWLDRPLTLAGRISLRSKDPFKPRDVLVSFDRPLLYIPNLSIHHNKEVNSGVALNQQKDLIPLLGVVEEGSDTNGYFLNLIAEELGVDAKDILDLEMSMSEFERGCVMGANQEFISSTKLDNLTLVHAALNGLSERDAGGGTKILCCFDNEEIGNRTRQGADSPMLATALERIALGLGKTREEYLRAVSNSFMLSGDVSHALHPNVPERSDPVVGAKLNKGPVIKFSGTQKFTTDSNSSAVFKAICERAGIPCQYYVNRSDSPGGSSAGPASISQVAMRSVDIGIPVFAMHSIRELCGVMDNYYVYQAFAEFYA